MNSAHEKVLVVPRALLDGIGSFQGLCFNTDSYLRAFFVRENNRFMPRRDAEDNTAFKQLIPYAFLVWDNKVLHYERGSTGGEARLVKKGSIGIGGHINQSDENVLALDQSGYSQIVLRELREELIIDDEIENRVVALLNDDSNDVGKVHLGIVHRIRLRAGRVRPGETDVVNPQFLAPPELLSRRASLESWSQICLDNLKMLLETKGIL